MLGALLLVLWPRPPADPADRPLSPLPADGPLRIAAFGSSLTLKGGWPAELATRLSACLGRPVEVTVIAQAGAGSRWGLSQTGQVAAARPDLVLLEFVINDADIRDGVRLRTARAQHAALLDALPPQAQVMLMTMNPVYGMRAVLQRPRLAAYDAMLRDLAAARDVALADLAPRWRRAWAEDPALVPPDGLHPAPAATLEVTVPALAGMIAAAAGAATC